MYLRFGTVRVDTLFDVTMVSSMYDICYGEIENFPSVTQLEISTLASLPKLLRFESHLDKYACSTTQTPMLVLNFVCTCITITHSRLGYTVEILER